MPKKDAMQNKLLEAAENTIQVFYEFIGALASDECETVHCADSESLSFTLKFPGFEEYPEILSWLAFPRLRNAFAMSSREALEDLSDNEPEAMEAAKRLVSVVGNHELDFPNLFLLISLAIDIPETVMAAETLSVNSTENIVSLGFTVDQTTYSFQFSIMTDASDEENNPVPAVQVQCKTSAGEEKDCEMFGDSFMDAANAALNSIGMPDLFSLLDRKDILAKFSGSLDPSSKKIYLKFYPSEEDYNRIFAGEIGPGNTYGGWLWDIFDCRNRCVNHGYPVVFQMVTADDYFAWLEKHGLKNTSANRTAYPKVP